MRLECSTKGDVRFSALYATVEIFGKKDTIENHYQLCKRFDGVAPKTAKEAKGKAVTSIVLNGKEFEPRFLMPFYKIMWVRYLERNPALVAYASRFSEFTDSFRGKAMNCQADVIAQYIKEGRKAVLADCQELIQELRNIKQEPKEDIIRIAATGHRPNKLPGGYEILHLHNIALANKMKNHFLTHLNSGKKVHAISGMALGIDTLFALVALKLKRQGKNITLEAAIPCDNHCGNWPKASQDQWHSIVNQADKVTYVSKEPYKAYLMQKRNEYMVNNCDELVAFWDGTSGGTGNCVNYATSKNVQIVQFNPNDIPEAIIKPASTPAPTASIITETTKYVESWRKFPWKQKELSLNYEPYMSAFVEIGWKPSKEKGVYKCAVDGKIFQLVAGFEQSDEPYCESEYWAYGEITQL